MGVLLFPLCDDFVFQLELFCYLLFILFKPRSQIVVLIDQLFPLGKEDQMCVLQLLFFADFDFVEGATHFHLLNLE